jgi:hypothetical protein
VNLRFALNFSVILNVSATRPISLKLRIALKLGIGKTSIREGGPTMVGPPSRMLGHLT